MFHTNTYYSKIRCLLIMQYLAWWKIYDQRILLQDLVNQQQIPRWTGRQGGIERQRIENQSYLHDNKRGGGVIPGESSGSDSE